jgi:hypothetical protein
MQSQIYYYRIIISLTLSCREINSRPDGLEMRSPCMRIIRLERLENRDVNMRIVLKYIKTYYINAYWLNWLRMSYNPIPFEHNNEILGVIKPQYWLPNNYKHFKEDPEWRSWVDSLVIIIIIIIIIITAIIMVVIIPIITCNVTVSINISTFILKSENCKKGNCDNEFELNACLKTSPNKNICSHLAV